MSSKASTNAVTSVTDTRTVTRVPTMTPSIDFFGLTLGASGRGKNCPPHTDPDRNAAVS